MTAFVALMYHTVKDQPRSKYAIGIDDFKEQLAWLTGEGFVIDSFAGLERRLSGADIPERYVVMTFDDGHKSSLRAAEALRQVDAHASFFIAKGLCQNQPSFLNDKEIGELATLCPIGSHGISHFPLVRMSRAAMRAELAESKDWLENLTGASVNTLSAPGGYLNQDVVQEAIALGFSLLGNSFEWHNLPGHVAASREVNRIAWHRSFGLSEFKKIATLDTGFLLKCRIRSTLSTARKRLLR